MELTLSAETLSFHRPSFIFIIIIISPVSALSHE